jgi:uncharacterized protein
MPIDLTFYLSLIILTLAIFGQCLFGFGGGLIAIPVLGLLIGMKDAVTITLVMQMLSVGVLIRVFNQIDWKVVVPVILGLIPGTLLGGYLLTILEEDWIRWALVVFILGYLIRDAFFSDHQLFILRRRWSGHIVGLFSGIIQGIIGTGGPPLVMYLNELSIKPDAFRAALLLWIFVTNFIRLFISLNAGLFSPQVIQISLYAIPLILIAMWAADQMSKKLNERVYGQAVKIILVGSVFALIMN